MRRTTVAGVMLVAISGMVAGCRCPFGKPTGPPEIDKLAVYQTADLFNGKDLGGWTAIVDDIFYDRTGKVEVVDGSVVLAAGQDMTGVRWSGKMLRDNFRIAFQARRVEGDDFFCGLTFPVRKGYVTLILGGWGGSAVGLSNIDDLSAIENETTSSIQFAKGKWYDIEVEVGGGRIVVAIDDKVIIDQKIGTHRFNVWPQMEPPRPLGFCTYSTKGAFRKFAVQRLAAD